MIRMTLQAGLRHDLPEIEVMDEHAQMNANAGRLCRAGSVCGAEADAGRSGEQGFLVGDKDHTLALGKCDRCGTVVEPRLSTQWFIKIQPLAERAIEAVEKGDIRFTPENYRQIYLNWMDNIHDWCISRQLWWGHRIPAWHCGSARKIMVAREAPTKCRMRRHAAGAGSGRAGYVVLVRAAAVYYAWVGRRTTRDLEVFYPTSLLVTGFDILFFWVARMIMLGCRS